MRILGRFILLGILAALVCMGLALVGGAIFWLAAVAFPALGQEVGLHTTKSGMMMRYSFMSPVAIVTGPIVLLVVLVGLVFVVRALSAGDRPTRSKAESAEESRLMQEMNRGLAALEDRVETLETLLLDRAAPRDRKEP